MGLVNGVNSGFVSAHLNHEFLLGNDAGTVGDLGGWGILEWGD